MKVHRGFAFILSIVIFVITSIPQATLIINAENSTFTENEVISAALAKCGGYYPADLCLSFVADFWNDLGVPRTSACCAHNYGNQVIVSTEIDNIPIGADVFFNNSLGTYCNTCGYIPGHVGIYIGEGYMIDAANGKIRRISMDVFNKGNWSYRGWGYHKYISINHGYSLPPQNISITSDNTTAMIGGTMKFKYNIENANISSYIGIDKDGKRYDSIPINESQGDVQYTFKEAGTYCVIAEGSNEFGYACCDGIWITVVEPISPQNITISSDNTVATVGGTIAFDYTIDYAYSNAAIGIDKDGTRYDTIPISGSPGRVLYTFTETGTYCVITEGSNELGYACCDGVWITVVDPILPQNITIKSDNTMAQVGETMAFDYTIDYAYSTAAIGIDKDGTRYDTIPISGSPGRVLYTFTEPGTYCVITEGSNELGYACCDGVWITVIESSLPQNISIIANKTNIIVGETISFDYSIDYAYDAAGVAIDRDGKRYESIPVNSNQGTVKYTFTEPGTYCVITEGRNSSGYACCDGVWIFVNEKIEGDITLDGSLSTTDVVLLQKYLLCKEKITKEQWENADINKDEKVNIFDLILLKKKLLNKRTIGGIN